MPMTRWWLAAGLAFLCTGTAMGQKALFGNMNPLQVVAGWDGSYDTCEARHPALQGHRDLMLMLAYGASVRSGTDDYHRAVTHLGGLRTQPGYQPEYQAARARAESAAPERLNALCQRMAQGLKEAQSRQR